MLRAAVFVALSAAFLLLPVAPVHAQPSPTPPAATVRAGAGEPGYSVTRFLPAAVTVHAGETVRWQFTWFEPHSVTFGTPQTGAPLSTPSPATYDGPGFLTSDVTFGPGKVYDVTFTRPGRYSYNCSVHEGMTGVVAVVASASASDSPAAVTARGQDEYNAAIAGLRRVAADLAAQAVTVTPLGDGTREHQVFVATATADGDTQQFFPPTITIREGDTVRWHTRVRTPHTVTFGPFPAGRPFPGNPAIDTPARPAAAYAGEGYWNSGLLGVERPAGTDWSLSFARPGTFAYYCTLHASQGHRGEVVVLPREAAATPSTPVAPRPPDTGSGRAHSALAPLVALGSVAVVLAAAAALALVAGRR